MNDVIRILLAEDDAAAAAFLEKVLRRQGFEIIGPYDSGLDVVYATLCHSPDLLIMDIGLQGPMNGIEAAEAIRRDSPVPILFLTGHSSVPMRQQAALIEGTGFLEKTADMELLRQHIYLLLSHLRSTGV